MSLVLDAVTGGGLLPYVYCKKITLENAGSPGVTNITFNLELYLSVNEISKSSWLNSLGIGTNQFLDSMFIQVLPIKEYNNVIKLRPSNEPLVGGDSPGNIYVAKKYLSDGYLARGKINDKYDIHSGYLHPAPKEPPAPIQVSISSLLGNLSKKDVLLEWEAEGKVREELVNGQAYYVIPFQYEYQFDESESDLGFAFYTFLHTPYFFDHLGDPGYTVDAEFFENYIVEGPVNAEVVYLNGEVQMQREAFFLPNGQAWEGSVHLHGPDNPDPSGYQGNGGLSGLSPAAPYTGWMVGEKHKPGQKQEKLRLASVHNNKISDFRSNFAEENLDGYLAFDDKEKFNDDLALIEFLGNQTLKQFLGPGNTFLMPFEKNRKVHLMKGATISKSGKLVGSSNDSEYSKLYVTRDRDNNARGLFFINFKNLLENNSNLYPLLFQGSPQPVEVEQLKEQIMSYCSLLELKVYRDRVDRHLLSTKYEEYLNDGIYEEPSKLIGSISDLSGYQTPAQKESLSEISLSFAPGSSSGNPFINRYFMFTDKDVGSKSAGLYRYRVELTFKDGTYEFLYGLLKEAARLRVLLDKYYDLSVSGYNKYEGEYFFDANLIGEEYKKANFIPYFRNNSFGVEFEADMQEHFPDQFKPWIEAPKLIKEILTAVVPTFSLNFDPQILTNIMQPSTGSPRGIDYFISLLTTCTKRLQKLIGTTKIKKSGSDLDDITAATGYKLNSYFDFVVSPSEETIYEQHTFDSPDELFEGLTNEDVYIDYLSIFAPLSTGFTGLRKVSPDYYIDRARLDAAKFSPLALNMDAFDGVGEINYKNTVIEANIGLYSAQPLGFGGGPFIPAQNNDRLSRTAYAYLTPSIVEFSDPTKQNRGFIHYYSAFNNYARNNLNAGNENIFSNMFTNMRNYDRLLISLLNYNINKQNYIDSDTTHPYYWKSNPEVEGNVTGRMETRDAYKRVAEQDGLTLHDDAKYASFFNKPAGPTKEQISSYDLGEHYPLELDDFSDNNLFMDDYLKFYVPNQAYSMPKPAIRPYKHSVLLPNSFKYSTIFLNRVLVGKSSIFSNFANSVFGSFPLVEAIEGADNPFSNDASSFVFFQMNYTSRIEVFRGVAEPFIPKDDEKSWSPLTISDINAIQEGRALTFFCRIKLYDEKFSHAASAPILDRYFLLNKSGVNVPGDVPPAEPGYKDRVREWEAENYGRIEDFRILTEKGIRDTRRRDVLRPPPIQPDPDPSRQRPRRTVPDPRARVPEHEREARRQDRSRPRSDGAARTVREDRTTSLQTAADMTPGTTPAGVDMNVPGVSGVGISGGALGGTGGGGSGGSGGGTSGGGY